MVLNMFCGRGLVVFCVTLYRAFGTLGLGPSESSLVFRVMVCPLAEAGLKSWVVYCPLRLLDLIKPETLSLSKAWILARSLT